MRPHQDDILNFLASLVGALDVSAQGTHVSMATYASRVQQHFSLTSHYNVQDLQNAIKQITFRGGNDNLSAGLAYILQLISTASLPSSSDRLTAPDVVIVITDHSAQTYAAKFQGNCSNYIHVSTVNRNIYKTIYSFNFVRRIIHHAHN